MNNREDKTELQQRIAAELREKQMRKGLVGDDLTAGEFDIDDSAYVQDLKPTTTLSWAWLLIGVAVIGTVIAIIAVV